MALPAYVMGLDFGTDSVRCLLVNAIDGNEVADAYCFYPRWKEKKYINAERNLYRQHPLDYIEALEIAVKSCIAQTTPEIVKQIKAIGVDATGSTPVAVNKSGKPLALLPQFSENKNAMFILWKDHTAINEAEEINKHARKFETDYLKYMGGTYSSEWFWAKALHILRTDDEVRDQYYSWVEQSDWIPFLLTGGNNIHKLKRNRCAAGHKSGWSEEFNGLPKKFWSSIDPLLEEAYDRLFSETFTSDQVAGRLSEEWAEKLGLSTEVIVTVGIIDAHAGAIGAQVEPYSLCKIIGTSTCDIMVVPKEDMVDKFIEGICGQVDGSVIPNMIGLEAGQSAFGDLYQWFQDLLLWPIQELIDTNIIDDSLKEKIKQHVQINFFRTLEEEAFLIPLNDHTELAIDWFNGRRSPDANQKLKGSFHNLTLGSTAPRIYRALVESTCFGAKKINEGFIRQGILINKVIALGGVAQKSAFVMQMLADILNCPIIIHKSEQTCASGAAMLASVAAGIHPDLSIAMLKMGAGFKKEYIPDPEKVKLYSKRYQQYLLQGQLQETQTKF
ncbi:MAG: ribulokinase [Chitinophagaceae bacterium]